MSKNLFQKNTIADLEQRINSLEKDTIPLWGQMNVGQMLAHCCEVLKNALGETQQKRKLIGYLIAPFVRTRFYDDIPYKKRGGPSTFVITDKKDLKSERQNLIELIKRFHAVDKKSLNNSVHPILGKFKPEQWAIGQYKHLDHHLRQFGV